MKLILPLSVTIPRKTKADMVFALNLNIYRNAHYMTLNPAKVLFKEKVEWIVSVCNFKVEFPPPYHFRYTVFPKDGRAFDLGNVLSIVQKFNDDALIELGLITNDNYKIVRAVDYRFGHPDKDSARVELQIRPYIEDVWEKP